MIAFKHFVLPLVTLALTSAAATGLAQQPVAGAPAPAPEPAPAPPPPSTVPPEPVGAPPPTYGTLSGDTSTIAKPESGTAADTLGEPAPASDRMGNDAPPYSQWSDAGRAGPFAKGRVSLSLILGSSFIGDSTYLILGAGIGYFLVDGLEASLGGSIWLFDEPLAGTISPALKYVLHMVPTLKPYVGVFYRHYMVGDDIDDFGSFGTRFGGYIVPNPRLYFGIGAVYEHLLDCENYYYSCDDFYPELSFMFTL